MDAQAQDLAGSADSLVMTARSLTRQTAQFRLPEGAGLRRRAVWLPLLRQFAFPLVALAALLPVIIPIAFGPGGGGTSILLLIRSPHHYLPLTYRDQFIPFLGWLLVLAAGVRCAEAGRPGGMSQLPRAQAPPSHMPALRPV